ncbi:MAG TPA: molybdopterin oxidoreductase [Firmicutes bacterium]|nr:molybdopterin oxidoreductase [Bacillota bacterium]
MSEKQLICIVCPIGCHLKVDEAFNVSGNQCKRGLAFAKKELTNPTRMVTTTVRIKGAIHNRLPVVSTTDVPKHLVEKIVREVQKVELSAPIVEGDVILANILETGVDMIAARDLELYKISKS